MSTIRTTLTLDDDLAAQLHDEAHRRRSSFRQVVNDAIRRGLKAEEAPSTSPPYVTPVHECRLLPGIDASRLNQLADELEDEAYTTITLARS